MGSACSGGNTAVEPAPNTGADPPEKKPQAGQPDQGKPAGTGAAAVGKPGTPVSSAQVVDAKIVVTAAGEKQPDSARRKSGGGGAASPRAKPPGSVSPRGSEKDGAGAEGDRARMRESARRRTNSSGDRNDPTNATHRKVKSSDAGTGAGAAAAAGSLQVPTPIAEGADAGGSSGGGSGEGGDKPPALGRPKSRDPTRRRTAERRRTGDARDGPLGGKSKSGDAKDPTGNLPAGETVLGPDGKPITASPGRGKRTKPKLVRKASHRGMINQLALQFNVIRKSFTRVQDVFRAYMSDKYGKDRKNQKISLDRLGGVLTQIGEHKSWTDAETRELFHLADLDGSKTIEFREFLICIAVGYFLRFESENKEFQETAKGFKVVQKAFKDMDDDGSNTVDAEELKKALFASSFKSDTTILEARFRELDFNGDGDVSFPEFLYGFSQWVGFGDEDEDDHKAHEPTPPAGAGAGAGAAESKTAAAGGSPKP